MHPDPTMASWPDYSMLYQWLCQEVDGLQPAQLDFDAQAPAPEWMWWSIRRQVSHIAWVLLVFIHRRCHMFLWPDGQIPTPIRWEDHSLAGMKFDRRLDETLYWDLTVLLEKVKLGCEWATHVVTMVPLATLRATRSVHTGTPFWRHVMQVIPRGVWVDTRQPNRFHYTLEASLWMVYWEILAHLFTIQRLKQAQGLPGRVSIPHVGYLTLPEYTGETEHPAPAFTPLR